MSYKLARSLIRLHISTSRVICGVLIVGVFGCTRQDPSGLLGIPPIDTAPEHARGSQDENPKPVAKSQYLLHRLTQSFWTEARDQMARLHGLNPRKNTADLLLKLIKTYDGIPRPQIETLFGDIHKQNSKDTVRKILGFESFETSTFLDDLYWEIAEDRNLKAPCQNRERQLFLSSLDRPDSMGPMPKPRRPWHVVYHVARGLQRTGIQFAADNSLLTLNIFPRDLRRARNIRCAGDICEGEFVSPLSAGVNIPLGLMAYVTIRYYKSKSAVANPNNRIEHSVWMGGGITPLNLFGLISVTLDLSFEILNEREHTPEGLQVDSKTKVICYGSISCDSPLFSVMASVDPKGFEFMSYVNTPGLGDDMAMVYPMLPSAYRRVSFPGWVHDRVNTVKGRLIKATFGPTPALHHDVYWNSFVGLPAPSP